MNKQKVSKQLLKSIKQVLDCNNSSDEFKSKLNQIALGVVQLYHRDQQLQKKTKSSTDTGLKLTKREFDIVFGISMERTNEELAKDLGIKKRTVDTHRQRILRKFGVKNTAGLVRVAFQKGILK